MMAAPLNSVRAPKRTNDTDIHDERETRVEAIRKAAWRAAESMPTVQRVVLYGSLVAAAPILRAEAVLLVEVSSSPHAEPRARVPGMLRALSPLPCSVDLFVLTADEVARFSAEGSPLLRAILHDGIDLVRAG